MNVHSISQECASRNCVLSSPGQDAGATKSQKKTKSRKPPRAGAKKPRARRKVKNNGASAVPLFDHRAVEHRFIAEHPEAFDPFIGEWVVLEGTSIVAHGHEPVDVVNEARSKGIKVPYILRVDPKRKPNEGYL
jgi:hypothetical protein